MIPKQRPKTWLLRSFFSLTQNLTSQGFQPRFPNPCFPVQAWAHSLVYQPRSQLCLCWVILSHPLSAWQTNVSIDRPALPQLRYPIIFGVKKIYPRLSTVDTIHGNTFQEAPQMPEITEGTNSIYILLSTYTYT